VSSSDQGGDSDEFKDSGHENNAVPLPGFGG